MRVSMSPYLSGKLLLAMPGMGDPRFNKAVIFMCSHDEKGAMGLAINNPLNGMSMEQLFKQLKFNVSADAPMELQIMAGGPVETQRGFLLHHREFNKADTIMVDRYGISGTLDALKSVAEGTGPKDLIFALGYAGWGAGQLEREILENAWLTVDADDVLLFRTEPDEIWDRAFGKIGIKKPSLLSHMAGTA